MTQTSRISLSRRMTAAVVAVVAAASWMPAQAKNPHRGGHEQPAYQGGYRSDHRDYRGYQGDYRGGRDDDRDGGGVLVGALLGAVVGAALVGAMQPPPAVVYSAPPPPPPPGVDYYPDNYPPGY